MWHPPPFSTFAIYQSFRQPPPKQTERVIAPRQTERVIAPRQTERAVVPRQAERAVVPRQTPRLVFDGDSLNVYSRYIIKKEELVCFFDIPLIDTARILGVCRDSLRRIRAWAGATLWPYDTVRSGGDDGLVKEIRRRRQETIAGTGDAEFLKVLSEADRFAVAYWRARDPAVVRPKVPNSTGGRSTAPKSTEKKSTGKKSTAVISTDVKSTAGNSTDKKSTDKKSTAGNSTDAKSTALDIPIPATPIQPAPIPAIPIQPTPIQPTPIQPAPIQPAPIPPDFYLQPFEKPDPCRPSSPQPDDFPDLIWPYAHPSPSEIQHLETMAQIIRVIPNRRARLDAPGPPERVPAALEAWADLFLA